MAKCYSATPSAFIACGGQLATLVTLVTLLCDFDFDTWLRFYWLFYYYAFILLVSWPVMKMIYACNLIERRGQVLRLASDSAVAAAVAAAAVSVDAADAVNAKR